MAEKNIIDEIENYFLQTKELFGETIYLDEDIKNLKDDNKEQLHINLGTTPKSLFDKKVEKGVETDWEDASTLKELYNKIHKCKRCQLGDSRTNFVFGSGNPNADIMIIGEAPGADEDAQGKPFVGRAGKLLTKILESINLSREEVFIANILKCRPPQNRKPLPEEEDKCEPYLKKQIELIKPAFILALGLTAVDRLLGKKNKMGDIRGTLQDYHGIKMLVTYHPAALLRNPNWKRLVWEDVKLLRKLYDEYLENNQ